MVNILDLGTCDYKEALDIQLKVLKKVQDNELDDTFILVEHPHVLTLGKRGKTENIYVDENVLNKKKIKVYEINRGGDVTYHGYGQLVGYPIINLANHEKNIRKFVNNIENIFIENLKDNHGIEAREASGKYTGVWVGEKKITAIGIGVKKWTTYHGFAYNINTDLEYFSLINPCGLGEGMVTSLKEIKAKNIDFALEKQNIIMKFLDVFAMEGRRIAKEEIGE